MVIYLPCAANPHALLMPPGTEMGTDTPGDLNVPACGPARFSLLSVVKRALTESGR